MVGASIVNKQYCPSEHTNRYQAVYSIHQLQKVFVFQSLLFWKVKGYFEVKTICTGTVLYISCRVIRYFGTPPAIDMSVHSVQQSKTSCGIATTENKTTKSLVISLHVWHRPFSSFRTTVCEVHFWKSSTTIEFALTLWLYMVIAIVVQLLPASE